jgi:hypothetical protein
VSLTTPEPRDDDYLFPGENWFMYWRTSPALWESKLKNSTKSQNIIVPINWALHSGSSNKEGYDFGIRRPETNIKKIYDLATGIGKKLNFFVFLNPSPFLPNGGIPHYLARTPSINRIGATYSLVDNEDSINHLYSFYDPAVFQAFSIFTKDLGDYFIRSEIDSSIWGIENGYLSHENFQSYFDDNSTAFDHSFSKFLSMKKENNPERVLNNDQEDKLVTEFNETIRELYIESAQEGLLDNWAGVSKVAFLGGNPIRLFQNSRKDIDHSNYSNDIYTSVCSSFLPSSVLLQKEEKDEVLQKQLNEVKSSGYFENQINQLDYEEAELNSLMPLIFFEIYKGSNNLNSWNETGLWKYINSSFKWCYNIHGKIIEDRDDELDTWSEEKILFYPGAELDEKSFSVMIKKVVQGQHVILDKSGMSDVLLKKLQQFLLENQLETEAVKFYADLERAKLEFGTLLIIQGDDLLKISEGDQTVFWHRVLSTFDFIHLDIKTEEGVEFYWRTRVPNSLELQFEEIRRVSLFNPTSYKKKVDFKITNNFALAKVLDDFRVEIESHKNHVSLLLMPGGNITLELGVFS